MNLEKTHLRKYRNRPAQSFIEGIGWVLDTNLNNKTIIDEINRINMRNNKRKLQK